MTPAVDFHACSHRGCLCRPTRHHADRREGIDRFAALIEGRPRIQTSPCGFFSDGTSFTTSPSRWRTSSGRTGASQRNSSTPMPRKRMRPERPHLDKQAHRDRGRVPTGGGQAFKRRLLGGGLVEMVRLRVELGGEALDVVARQPFPGLLVHGGSLVLQCTAAAGRSVTARRLSRTRDTGCRSRRTSVCGGVRCRDGSTSICSRPPRDARELRASAHCSTAPIYPHSGSGFAGIVPEPRTGSLQREVSDASVVRCNRARARACASGGNQGGSTESPVMQQRLEYTRVETPAGPIEIDWERQRTFDETNLLVDVDKAWAALPATYGELGIEPGIIDSEAARLRNGGRTFRREMGRQRLSKYFDCGATAGMSNSDNYDLYIRVISQIVPQGDKLSCCARRRRRRRMRTRYRVRWFAAPARESSSGASRAWCRRRRSGRGLSP